MAPVNTFVSVFSTIIMIIQMLHAWIFSITSNTYFNNQWFKKKIYTSHFPASDSTFQPAGQLTRKLVNMPTDQTSGQ